MCFLLHLRAVTITAFMTKDSGSFGAQPHPAQRQWRSVSLRPQRTAAG